MDLEIHENFSLAGMLTFGVETKTRYFTRIRKKEQIPLVFSLPYQPRIIIGGGSNCLFISDYPGLVIKNEITGISIIQERENEVIIEAGGGVIWHELVLWTLRHGLGGLENLSLIPGTVGAAPIQNIGAYGVEFDEVFYQLCAYDYLNSKEIIFQKEDCQFSYRSSIFKEKLRDQFFISTVQLRLSKNQHQIRTQYGDIKKVLDRKGISNPDIRQLSDAVIEIRTSKLPDPVQIGNAGSFFKNPVVTEAFFGELRMNYPDVPCYPFEDGKVKIPAGWLIEKNGWKGYRFGFAGVYDKHALVLVNYGHATGREIWHLAQAIMESVEQVFGISLEPEVNIIDEK